jgi:ADP-dependent NAD(P)H-hydrate dehydratase / NAD(P)H-hydrate epimerase
MKLFETEKIAFIDKQTIQLEPISDIDLMERAATQFTDYILCNIDIQDDILIFCGPGNNGGDGLAVARHLSYVFPEKIITVALFPFERELSPSTKINHERICNKENISCKIYQNDDAFPIIKKSALVIDALFGSGLNRRIEGYASEVIKHINKSNAHVISVDIPSGLMSERNENKATENIIKARLTLTFQFPKISFLFAENAIYTGRWEVLDIKLHQEAIENTPSNYFLTDKETVTRIVKRRSKFSHKGDFGHALLIAGSYGKMGASLLASESCLRSGVGLLTSHLPHNTYHILQTALPEAMCSIDDSDLMFTGINDIENYDAIGIGPALGTKSNTQKGVHNFLSLEELPPLVIDADALNIIGLNPEWLDLIPNNTILTPHVKEFERIAGKTITGYERFEKAMDFAKNHELIVVLKGAFTLIACPDGQAWFNPTGNPGMATAGSGDVLTGIILGLLAQGYSPKEAAIAGVFVHGLAGDLAMEQKGQHALLASDISSNLGYAFKLFEK